METSATTRIRYGETDQMGVVYHANYLIYFDLGRTEYLRARGCPIGELERRGFFLPVVKAGIRYKASARYDDLLIISTRLENVNKFAVTFYHKVMKEEGSVPLAEGTVTLACVTREEKLQRMPTDVMAALADNG